MIPISKLILSAFLILLFYPVFSQNEVEVLQIDYRIEIESGRDPKRPEVRPEPMVVFNRMFIYGNRAVYVVYDITKTWKDYSVKDKTTIWKKGKTSYKHEYKDSTCCIVYSAMKKRYRWESTVVEEVIAGRKTKKIIIYDDVNRKTYYVWVDLMVSASVSPIGFLPVNGLIMRLRNENIVYEVISRKVVSIPESFFEVNEKKYKFSEKAFRDGVIE